MVSELYSNSKTQAQSKSSVVAKFLKYVLRNWSLDQYSLINAWAVDSKIRVEHCCHLFNKTLVSVMLFIFCRKSLGRMLHGRENLRESEAP